MSMQRDVGAKPFTGHATQRIRASPPRLPRPVQRGLSSSSQGGLFAEIDRLGTNMLTVEAGQSLTGEESKLPREAPARITHLNNVQLAAHTGLMKDEKVYRNSMILEDNTGGLQVRATSLNRRLRGRKQKLNPRQEAHLVALHHAGAVSYTHLTLPTICSV